SARRLHQREQLVDGPLRDVTYPLGVRQPLDADALHDRPDLVAEVGDEPQGIALFIGDARDQAGDQDLASDHFAVQLVHQTLSAGNWWRRYGRALIRLQRIIEQWDLET